MRDTPARTDRRLSAPDRFDTRSSVVGDLGTDDKSSSVPDRLSISSVRVPTPVAAVAPLWTRARRLVHANRADIAGAAASCLALLIVLLPVLADGRTLSTAAYTFSTNGSDPFPGQDPIGQRELYRLDGSASALQFEPWAEVIAAQFWDGDLPLWNPYQGAGTPLAANMSSAVFDPLALPINLDPTPLTWDLTMISTMLLGVIATYAFCRVVGMGYLAGVAGATIFGLSGYFTLYSNNGFFRAYAYLPILCLIVEWLVRTRRLSSVVALGVATFGCIAVGMPETAFFVLLVAGSYALWRTLQGPRARTRTQCIAAIAGGFAFGLAIAAPLLVTFLEYERISFNDHKGSYGGGLATDAGRHLITWLTPFLNGEPNDATSAPGTWSGVRNWVGAGAGALVLVGIASRTRAAKITVGFFGLTAVLVLMKAYGFPLVTWIGGLPVAKLVVFPAYGLPVVGFAIAIVAAAGVDGIRRGQIRLNWLLGAVVISAPVVYVLMWSNQSVLRAIPTSQLVRELAIAVVASAAVLVAATALRPRVAAYVVTLLVAAELIILAPAAFGTRSDPFDPPQWTTTLKTAMAERPYDRVFGLDGVLYPNTAGAHGLFDIRMLDALFVDRYQRYLRAFVDPYVSGRFVGAPIGSSERGSAYRDNQMFDLLGVRYLVAKEDLNAVATEAADAQQLEPVGRFGNTYIFSNRDVLPRAFVVHDVDVVDDLEASENYFAASGDRFPNGAIRVTGLDVRNTAVVEADPESIPQPLIDGAACEEAETSEAVEITSYKANEVRIQVESPCAGLLVLSDTYFPGWRVSVNGEPSTIHPTDMALRGVVIDRGRSEIVFRYQPSSFRTGVFIALGAVTAMLAAVVGRSIAVRRRRSPL